jgi:predicted transcriptional regulator
VNIQAEKLKLIEWLAGLTDQTLIERIKFLKETQSTKTDWWEEISEAEKDAIDQGLEDAQNGNVTAHEEVRKRYEKWL